MVSNEEVLVELTSSAKLKHLLDEVVQLKKQVQRIADALEKQQDRKSYQAAYYKKRKAAKAAKVVRLPNKDRHCLDGPRDPRLPHAAWAKQLKKFAERGLSVYNFISWLAWTWNQKTYEHSPITKSGGYFHVLIGMSGGKPLRAKYSERDVTGHMRVSRFSRLEQLDTLRDALFWKWTFVVLCEIVNEAEEEGWFEALGESWTKPLKIALGSLGCYEIKGEIFDPCERDLEVASKTYGWLRPTLEMNWSAFLRGLFSKEEPFTLPP